MSQNRPESGGAPSRTIFINPFYKKPNSKVVNNATNAPQIILSGTHINPNFKKPDVLGRATNIIDPKIILTGAHINPLFLSGNRPPTIHMNPNFLKSKVILPQHNRDSEKKLLASLAVSSTSFGKPTDVPSNSLKPPKFLENLIVNPKREESLTPKVTAQKIISKSRTKIVREPATINKVNPIAVPQSPSAPLIRLSSRKLVRRTHLSPGLAARAFNNITPAKTNIMVEKYKLDRRVRAPMVTDNKIRLSSGVKFKRKTFVARYALQRSNLKLKTVPRSFERRSMSINKKIQMLNINGVLYRSTRNKLQRKDANNHPKTSGSMRIPAMNIQSNSNKNSDLKPRKTLNGHVLFVHGTKFVLDKSGYKLTRMTSGYPTSKISSQDNSNTPRRQRRRIDIGGLTYIASTTLDVFIRTRNHLALAHLNMAKNRSLQFLTRRFVKTNIPCAIFQRIGKCSAHERGKCNKVHDKKQVTICNRFLRGLCHNPTCLLSHNVSLAKMPVCRFYLQGVCVRPDCPYLHKKLSVNTDICPDFLRGYCKLAELCNKRHEFLCPEYERHGKCELINCMYCKSRKRKYLSEQSKPQKAGSLLKNTGKEVSAEANEEINLAMHRYFIDKETDSTTTSKEEIQDNNQENDPTSLVDLCDSDNDMHSVQVRPKVGALPAFIPLT